MNRVLAIALVLALGACILVVSFVVVVFSQWLRRRGAGGVSDTGL